MTNLINCGTCGYPLTPEERTTLIERDGVMVKPAPVQEPVAWVEYETGNNTKRPQNCGTGYCSCIECVMEPPQRTWVGLMRGVRVDGDTVVITVKGGNDAARGLCGDLLNEMEKMK